MKRKISAARRAQLIKQLEKARKAKKRKAPRDIFEKMDRAQKRREAKRKKGAKRPRKINPIRTKPLYIIVAQKGNGPRMHFDGMKFTTNGKPAMFATEAQLKEVAQKLLSRYPMLREYKLIGKPIAATVSGK